MTKFKLDLYQGVQFKPSDNCVVGDTTKDLTDYLAGNNDGRSVVHTDTQNLVRFSPVRSIVVALPTEYTSKILESNYAQIIDDASRCWFYFVTGVSFVSRFSVRLSLEIDALNTFYHDAIFKNTCHIVRRNKTRWLVDNTNKFWPIYDYSGEGFDISQYLEDTKDINEGDSLLPTPQWLMAIATETKRSEQVGRIRFYPVGPTDKFSIEANFRNIDSPTAGAQGIVKKITYNVFSSDLTGQLFNETSDHTTKLDKIYALPYYPPILRENTGDNRDRRFLNSEAVTWYYRETATEQGTAAQMSLFASCPALSIIQTMCRSNFDKKDIARQIADRELLFNESYQFPRSTAAKEEWRKADLESRLFNPAETPEPKLGTSQFRTLRFEYQGASFSFGTERTSDGTFGGVAVDYFVSYNSGSPIMFRIRPHSYDRIADYKYSDDDNGYVIPSADRTYPLWTSDYNNYLNFSNKYDKTSAVLSTISAAGNAGSGIAGSAIASVMTGNPLPLVGGIVSAAFNTITSIVGTWNSYNAKLASEQQKSINVSQSSIDFASIQTNNKARFRMYNIPKFLRAALNNYFHLYGYATDEYGDPHDYECQNFAYNFIKLDSVALKNETSQIPNAFMQTFEEKLQQGYYVRHKIGDADDEWFDLNHENANFEKTLIDASAKLAG